ncbi:JAB domain-containing protein [Sphingobium chlorophenolicum]|uniref:JAB domain-containing protein n=1 Tax=Sphingobium chlorophenolicum TaxID=46429 RepID=UPI0001E4D007|nr:JAB domain-containing protein [Sphingobium chlorophenolicum]
MVAGMRNPASLQLLVLDDEWRPLHRLHADHDWRRTMDALLRWDSRWLAIEQRRTGGLLPHWADIRLTRVLSKRLRPMEIGLADHVIHSGQGRFSFREAGLL